MATGAQAVERIAAITGIPVVTVDKVARILKQRKPPLWARSVQGGGAKAGHVEPSHLVNIALGLTADPITSAPELIALLRGASPVRSVDASLPGATLGEALEWLIANADMVDLSNLELTIRRTAGNLDAVTKAFRRNDAGRSIEVGCAYLPKAGGLPSLPKGALAHSVTLPTALLNTLIDLWADTKAHYAQTKTAAVRPGTAAATRDRDRDNGPADTSTRKANPRRGAGHSLPSTRRKVK